MGPDDSDRRRALGRPWGPEGKIPGLIPLRDDQLIYIRTKSAHVYAVLAWVRSKWLSRR